MQKSTINKETEECSSSKLATLVRDAQRGDKEAINTILHSVQPRIYRFSLQMCRNETDAEDVVQETLFTLFQKIEEIRSESAIYPWLYTVARNCCYKKFRLRAKNKAIQDEGVPVEVSEFTQGGRAGVDPVESMEATESRERVTRAIHKIRPLYREVLILRDVEGLSGPEAASIIGVSESTVKSRIHRARAELRDAYDNQPYVVRRGCPDIRRAFSEHMEGELTSDLCAAMEHHVEHCMDCARECDILKDALSTCNATSNTVPAVVGERVKMALLSVICKSN